MYDINCFSIKIRGERGERRLFTLHLVLLFPVAKGSELLFLDTFFYLLLTAACLCCYILFSCQCFGFYIFSLRTGAEAELSAFFSRIRKRVLMKKCEKTLLPTHIFI